MLPGRITRISRLALCAFLAAQSAACGVLMGDGRGVDAAPATTYRKFLARAEAGDAESQNVVGFMLFHGEGVRMDRDRALTWFRQSAEQGNIRAQRNLVAMASLETPQSAVAPVRTPAGAPTQAQQEGQTIYSKFCAGCHGFNGISAYVHSPSFALGEALEKGDAELMISLLRGKGEMPNWDDKLSHEEIVEVLRFVRTLPAKYEVGIVQRLSSAPPLYYLFGPMRSDQPAYRERLRDYGLDVPGTEK